MSKQGLANKLLDKDALYETIDGRYGKICFFANDPVIGESLRLYGEWAQIEIEFFEKLIPEGGTVLDVGGFIGTHALAFARFVGAHGHVHTFEPNMAAFELLSCNLAANDKKQVIAHRAAVGKIPETISLPILNLDATFNFGSCTLRQQDRVDADSASTRVDVVTIDSLGLERCDFIKIDVEGMESEVIEGANATIARLRPIIYAECNSLDSGERVLRALQKRGYETYLHVAEAFNPDNFKGATKDIFGICKEAGLFGLPSGRERLAHSYISPHWQLYEIKTIDDLVYALLQKPQYIDEVLRKSLAAKAGGSVAQEQEFQSIIAQYNADQKALKRQNEDLDQEIQAFGNLRETAARQSDELRALKRQNKALLQQVHTIGNLREAAVLRSVELQARIIELLEKQARDQRVYWQDRDQFTNERTALISSQQELQKLASEYAHIKRSNFYRVFRKIIRQELRLRDKIRKKKRKFLGWIKSLFKRQPDRSTVDFVSSPEVPTKTLSVSAIAGIRREPIISGRPLLLCLSHFAPFPPHAGNKYRTFRLLKWVQTIGYEVALVLCALPDEELSPDAVLALTEVYDNLIIVDRQGHIRYALAREDLIEAVEALSDRPIQAIESGFFAAQISQKLKETLATFTPPPLLELVSEIDQRNIASIYWINYAFMSHTLGVINSNALTLVDTHDVFSTKADKVTCFGIQEYLAVTTPLEEGLLLNRAQIVVAIQPDDAHELREILPNTRVLTVGVDIELTGPPALPVTAPVVLLVASANSMNIKGLEDFLRFAWPRIRRAVPEAELHVIGEVGHCLSGTEPGVVKCGLIDDLNAAYSRSRVVINPAVAGTGLKIKTLEAIMHLKPTVVWPSGIEGVTPQLRDYCYCVRDWVAFGDGVIHLLQDDRPAQRLYENRKQIADLLSPDHVYRDLEIIFAKIGTEYDKNIGGVYPSRKTEV